MYNIIRKHSEDSRWSIVGTASTKAEARTFIKEQVAKMVAESISLTRVAHMDDVTNVRFTSRYSAGIDYSIGYWFEKPEVTEMRIAFGG